MGKPDLIIRTVSKPGLASVPATNGVYVFYKDKVILYIGKSVNLKARLVSHIENAKLDPKEASIVNQSTSVSCYFTDSEFKALLLESRLIRKYKPKYNVRWRDDKSSLYIKITVKDDYPKVFIVRHEADPRSVFFGPFASVKTVEIILREIRRVFPYCQQKNISPGPCFYSKIGLCNPCPNYINGVKDREAGDRLRKIYRRNIRQIIRVLDGRSDMVLTGLYKELRVLTVKQDYESAIRVRTKINLLERLTKYQSFNYDEIFRADQSADALEKLREILARFYDLPPVINRIECYDISNLSFKNATASMVVVTGGLIDKSQYRRFRIKNTKLQSDFDMLEEVFTRRFRNSSWPAPELVVVDGGRPQVRRLKNILLRKNMNIPFIGIAKHPDRLIIGDNNLTMVKPKMNNLGFNLIRLLRDESHRFAKKYHLLLRSKQVYN